MHIDLVKCDGRHEEAKQVSGFYMEGFVDPSPGDFPIPAEVESCCLLFVGPTSPSGSTGSSPKIVILEIEILQVQCGFSVSSGSARFPESRDSGLPMWCLPESDSSWKIRFGLALHAAHFGVILTEGIYGTEGPGFVASA